MRRASPSNLRMQMGKVPHIVNGQCRCEKCKGYGHTFKTKYFTKGGVKYRYKGHDKECGLCNGYGEILIDG